MTGRRLRRILHCLLGGIPSTPTSRSFRLSSGAFARPLTLTLDITINLNVPVDRTVPDGTCTGEETSQRGCSADRHPPTRAWTRKCPCNCTGCETESGPRESMRYQGLELVSRGRSDVEGGEVAWPEQASERATVSMLPPSFRPSSILCPSCLPSSLYSADRGTPQTNPLTRSSRLARSAPIESSPHSPYRPTTTVSPSSPRSSPADLSLGS